jgi:hypothetical protein
MKMARKWRGGAATAIVAAEDAQTVPAAAICAEGRLYKVPNQRHMALRG